MTKRMAEKFESKRKRILNKIKIRFEVLYVLVQAKILLAGASFLRGKSQKGLLPPLLGLLLTLSPAFLSAQTPDWPWTLGESFQLTTDANDNFSPAIASNNLSIFCRMV